MRSANRRFGAAAPPGTPGPSILKVRSSTLVAELLIGLQQVSPVGIKRRIAINKRRRIGPNPDKGPPHRWGRGRVGVIRHSLSPPATGCCFMASPPPSLPHRGGGIMGERGLRCRASRRQLKRDPLAMPAGRDPGNRVASEPNSELAQQDVLVALEVGNADAVAVSIFETEVDK